MSWLRRASGSVLHTGHLGTGGGERDGVGVACCRLAGVGSGERTRIGVFTGVLALGVGTIGGCVDGSAAAF